MRQKIAMVAIPLVIGTLFWSGILDLRTWIMNARHFFYRGKGVVSQIGSAPAPKNPHRALLCRQQMTRIQNAKRKAAQDRGQSVGYVTWEQVIATMYPNESARGLTPARLQKLMPYCPERGTYTLGSLEELCRCTISGNDTLALDDDHIIRY